MNINHPTAIRLYRVANKQGSSAKTIKGLYKWFKTHSVSLPEIPFNKEEWLLHKQLDRCKLHDEFKMSDFKSACGYEIFPICDKIKSEDSYATITLENPRKQHVYKGIPKISGSNVISRWEIIHYKGKYKRFTGSNVYADYQSCIAIAKSNKTAVVITGNKVVRKIRLPNHYFFFDKPTVVLRDNYFLFNHTKVVIRDNGLYFLQMISTADIMIHVNSIKTLRQLQLAIREYNNSLPDGNNGTIQHRLKLIKDSIGYAVTLGPDEYHLTNLELSTLNVSEWVTILNKNAIKRKELAVKALAEKAQFEGIYVGIKDSLRAGNCMKGTQDFATRNKLDPKKHYNAVELLNIAGNDLHRVKLAIMAARLQYNIEMERGYANISDHFEMV